jgi:uncharacterized protein YwqG
VTRLFDRDRIHAALVEGGLEDHADALLGLIEPSVRLEPRATPEQEIPLGSSKLGGRPDVPPGFSWPTFRGRPQSFIAQVNLSEVHALPGGAVLPSSGLLSFFYDSEQSVWGFDPKDRAGWAVLHSPAEVSVQRAPFPASLPEHARYAPSLLAPRLESTFAPWESSDLVALGLSFDQAGVYSDAIPEPESELIHRLLGHPDPIQGDMQLEAQLAFHGLNCGDPSGYQDPRAESLGRGATDWRLLLQIDSDDDARMMWGDVGRLYYWIRRADLAGNRFDDVWLILQCT